MAAHSRQIGGHSEVWVDFEELHASGWAEVIAEGPCASIASGPGRVVTATITHANDDVRTLTLDGGETLYVTGNHRMYSASARDWVAVKDLGVGEELQTANGRKAVSALGYEPGRHQVFNIEVEAEHCYFVGNGQTLTHNGCSPTSSANNPDLKQLTAEAHSKLDPFAQGAKTTAIGQYQDGSLGIASSDDKVPKPQADWARSKGISVVNGSGHAEETLLKGGDRRRGDLERVDVSRRICSDCEKNVIKKGGVQTSTGFSGKKSKKRR